MLRIGISVEGATEREFVHQVISPYFSERKVLITPVPMNGNISLDRICHEMPALLGSDGVSTCPSRQLKALFPYYDKKFHGPSICQRIGLNNIRRACPRFNGWLIKLENLR
jgi:hypothetical protein